MVTINLLLMNTESSFDFVTIYSSTSGTFQSSYSTLPTSNIIMPSTSGTFVTSSWIGACGAPVVTTSGSAMADVCGDAALLVPPARPDLLADALGTVLDDPAPADRLRAAGPVRAT